jgi:hypothetical protein
MAGRAGKGLDQRRSQNVGWQGERFLDLELARLILVALMGLTLTFIFTFCQTLCCLINPQQGAITSIAILEQKVLESYPDRSKRDFFFLSQSKPLNQTTFDSLYWKDGSTIFVHYRNRGGCFIFSFSILCIILMAIVGSFCTCGSSLLIIPVLLPFLFILPLFCL